MNTASYITIRIPSGTVANFHKAIRISAAKSEMKIGEYLCSVLLLNKNFIEVLNDLK